MKYLVDFFGLIYPDNCAGCGNPLWKHERFICTMCDFHLPRTGFHLLKENSLSQIFRGRVNIESAAAFLFFNKGNTVQQLVHALKYRGGKDLGVWLGKQYGLALKCSPFFNCTDYILPVPLHPGKLISRGFNQSEQFAIGLGLSMNVPVECGVLSRNRKTDSQTKKARFHRWKNVEDVFSLYEYHKLEGKHLLLVDDVVTTGATLESCITALSGIPGTRISIATIAVAIS